MEDSVQSSLEGSRWEGQGRGTSSVGREDLIQLLKLISVIFLGGEYILLGIGPARHVPGSMMTNSREPFDQV